MKNVLTLIAAAFAFTALPAQTPEIGTPAWMAQHSQHQRQGGPAVNPLNGNDTLTTVYSNTACGLNYTMSSVRLGQRFTPVGLPQPAAMPVMLPGCATIDKAYLYTEALGVAPSITATLTNPANVATSYSMTLIGSSVDVCWGYNGTHVWRADVTSCITGSGNYTISGLPTSPNANNVDVEGATLVIIYMDGTASYTGSLIMDDGCHTMTGGSLNHTMTGFSACGNSTSANAFMLVGDMQMPGYTLNMNSTPVTQAPWNWWNELISGPTSVTNGQSTCNFDLSSSGDCYTLAVAGLYFQTGCQTCTPSSTNMSTTTSFTADNCNGNGSATVNVTGGSGNYTYVWMPGGQTTSTATNLVAGTYTVNIQDGVSCTSAIVTVPYTGAVLTMSAVGVNCSTPGSASVSVSGGVGPFGYSWAPAGGTGTTASNLSSGMYYVTVIDSGSGCTMTDSIFVSNSSPLQVSAFVVPDSCPSPSGGAVLSVSGGQWPYTYLWSNSSTGQSIVAVAAGTYTVTVTDAAGCSVTIQVIVPSAPSLYLLTQSQWTIPCSDSVQFWAYASDPSATFSWSPATYLDNPNSATPYCSAQVPMTYTLTATSPCGIDSAVVQVLIDSTNYYATPICFVTVDTAANKNVVIWEPWYAPSSGFVNIYRETSVSNVYTLIASQPVSQFSTFIDMTSNPQVVAERYKLTTTDTCGVESDTSAHHRTIHLQTSPTGNGGWNLAWTAYEGLPIQTYNIYRGASISTLTLLDTVNGNTFTYTDLTPPSGQNYYMIEAVHPFGGCTPMRLAHGNHTLEYSASVSNWSLATPNGVDENASFENSLVLSPNPGSGTFQLGLSLGSAQQVNVIVLDQLGRTVHTQSANGSKGTNTIAMHLEGLSAGVYFVQVNTPNGTATRRLVIK